MDEMRKISYNSKRSRFISGSDPQLERKDLSRLMLFRLFFAAAFAILGIRLINVQIIQGQEFRLRADENRIFQRTVPAARGVIVDRNGVELAVNKPTPKILVDEKGRVLAEPRVIDRETALAMSATDSARIVHDIGRFYPHAAAAAHVLGYIGEVTETDVQNGYLMGDYIGKAGIEKQYEAVVKGVPGIEMVEADAHGRMLRRVGEKPSTSGTKLTLNIDIRLQKEIIAAMDNRPGAAMVTNPLTGEVLALVSSPTFDPNIFNNHIEDISEEVLGVTTESQLQSQAIRFALTDENRPLMNRAISGTYPPGSVYKVVPSYAGLAENKIDPDSTIEDSGVITVDSYTYRNWYYTQYGGTEGSVDLTMALQRSNDIYYYKVGEMVGPEALAKWSQTFGLGSLTNIDLPGESAGLVPTPIWKERAKGERWFLGNTYHFAIGQGDLLVTPLQSHQMMGVIASRGRLCTPKVVAKIGDEPVKVECKELGLNQEFIDAIINGLEAACQSGGTAYPFFDFNLSEFSSEYHGERSMIACKTGTAQFFDPEDRTHAWFSVFAPSNEPEIMMTVLLEGAGEGSQEAAPVARRVLDWYFGQKKDN